MAKSKKSRRRSRRGTVRHSKPHITAPNIISGIVALVPVSVKAYDNYKKSGGGVNGIMKGILPTLSTSYSGYNPNDGKFYPNELIVGYIPLGASIIVNKLLNRVTLLRKLRM